MESGENWGERRRRRGREKRRERRGVEGEELEEVRGRGGEGERQGWGRILKVVRTSIGAESSVGHFLVGLLKGCVE